jgi:glycerophosphoryl diester phosphodiesterase
MSDLGWLVARPIAHRGLHDAGSGVIENTPSAFAAAVAGNYAIECDLQVTADGEAIVHHDDALGRLTEGSGRLDAMTSTELKRAPFKATTDRMITLGELCDLVAGRVTLVIELKRGQPGDERLPRRAAAVLARYVGPAALMSFEPTQIAAVLRSSQRITRGLVADRQSAHIGMSDWVMQTRRALSYCRDARGSKPQFLAYSVKDLPGLFPFAARRLRGLPLLTWTVRNADDRQRAARFADQAIFEGFRP